VLASADLAAKSELYAGLGLTLTYRPQEDQVAVEANAWFTPIRGVGGATAPLQQRPAIRFSIQL